jgi:hypothetical protein
MSRLNDLWFTVGLLLRVFVNLQDTYRVHSVHINKTRTHRKIFIKSNTRKFHENLLAICNTIRQFNNHFK